MFNTSPEELEKFERVKLEETKVINGNRGSLLEQDKVILEDLMLQFQNTTNKKVRNELKKKIKQLQKRING